MKKLLILLGSLCALVLIGAFITSFFLGSLVTRAVNTFAPKVTGTAVTLESAKISPITGEGTLTGLFVGNPVGWKSAKAFSFAKVHVSIEPGSLMSDVIVINEVVIEGPEFVYETTLVNSNIKDILANIEEFTGASTTPPPADKPATTPSKPIKWVVKSFRLENAKVTVGVGGADLTLVMPPLILADLGTAEGGITPEQLATQVMAYVLEDITRAASDAGVNSVTKRASESLKKLFGEGK